MEVKSSAGRNVIEAAVVIGALATIPLTVLQEQGLRSPVLTTIDWAVWGVFVTEFFYVLRAEKRLLSAWNLANFAVVVLSFPLLPNLLGLVRLARLLRSLRLLRLSSVAARGLAALKAIFYRRGLIYLTGLTALLIFAGGGFLAILEPQTVKGGYGDGIWWAIVTASTVGYGDISPSTPIGRLIAVALMVVGIGLMSTLAASITAHFVQQTENADLREIRARLERIEVLLQQGKSNQKEGVSSSDGG
jgi:voltage-gated potassium channel